MTIGERYQDVLARVNAALQRAGRAGKADEVLVVAVSKTFGIDAVTEALAAGVQALGENRAQELKQKAVMLPDAPWHFVGNLQTNKVRQVVGSVRLIHSVDRFGLAEAIARRARSLEIVQDVLLEVNIAREASKHGVEPSRTVALAEEIAGLEGLRVRGLMAMAPWAEDPEASRPFFKELAELGREVAGRVAGATELSMGMTRDLEVGVEEGATLVRVGEAIFGPRSGKAGPG